METTSAFENSGKLVVGVHTVEHDLLSHNDSRQKLREMLNERRARMPQLDPISSIIIRGATKEVRETNAQILKTFCEAAMFRLMNDDPRSNTAKWVRDRGGSRTPFLFRVTYVTINKGEDKPPLTAPAITICLNGIEYYKNIADTNKLKREFVSELGLVLTETNQRSLYPDSWEGRQAMTLDTVSKG